jgi:D-alanine-D-alanine ligase
MAKALRVLFAFDVPYTVERGHDFSEEFKDEENFYTEDDVYKALLANKYEVRTLGLFNDVRPLLDEVDEFEPDVIFNMVETFNEVTQWDKNIAGLIEMLGVPYTGASPAALALCNDKALCKKILRYHRVRVPRFHTFYRDHKIWVPKTLKLPCIIKPLTEEASRGISQASIVDDEKSFIDRVRMIHERMNLDVIAEEYIDGRELYVGMIGDRRLRVLPPREMNFGQLPDDEPRIATYKAKWDDDYREKWGIKNNYALRLSAEVERSIHDICKRAYRALNIRSYARFDLRITPEGKVYVIEPNVNPCIAEHDEFAQAAKKVGIEYPALIRMVINQALRRKN